MGDKARKLEGGNDPRLCHFQAFQFIFSSSSRLRRLGVFLIETKFETKQNMAQNLLATKKPSLLFDDE